MLNEQLLRIFWISGMLLQAVLAATMLYRRAWRSYPAFSAFILLVTLRSPILFASYHSAHWYLRIYLVGMCIETIIIGFVLIEIIRDVFAPLKSLPRNEGMCFLAALTIVAVVSIGIGVYHPANQNGHWLSVLRTVHRSASMIAAATMAFIVLFSAKLGIYWRDWVYGIGLGMLFFFLVDSVCSALSANATPQAFLWLRYIPMLAGFIALTTWLFYFSKEDTRRCVLSSEDAQLLLERSTLLTRSLESITEGSHENSATGPVGEI
jgi:hypothetical protein